MEKNWLWPAANQSQLSQQVKVAIFEEKNWVFKTTCWRALIDLIILSIAKVHLAPFSKRQDHNVGDDHTSDRPVGMVRSAKWPNQEEIGGEIKVRLGYALVLTYIGQVPGFVLFALTNFLEFCRQRQRQRHWRKTIFDNFAARMWHIPSTLSFTLAKNLELRHLHEVIFW